MNGLTNKDRPLNLHCWSKDDNLGEYHTLCIGGDFHLQVWHGGISFTKPIFHVISSGPKASTTCGCFC
ncbi:hypothetical protein Peur_056480 [Populus x canadensis]